MRRLFTVLNKVHKSFTTDDMFRLSPRIILNDRATLNDSTIGYQRTTNLSRRQFLSRATVAVGASLIATPGMTQSSTSNIDDYKKSTTKDELPILVNDSQISEVAPIATCSIPHIETRLFASSNVGHNNARNDVALRRMACAGFKVANPDIVSRQYLRFAGTDSQRASDLQNIATGAISAPKLLLGVRGGYGAVRLLPMVDWMTLGRIMQEQGTILAGFSDVTAIQCALLAKGKMSSLAAPMLYSEFGKAAPDQTSCRQFVEALSNPNLTIDVANADLTSPKLPTILAKNETNSITGTIWGGNLSVVSALGGSEYLPRIDGGIVFLEDVGEQPYQIERMLYDLYLAGVFRQQQAIVFGSLTGTGEDSYDKRYDVATVIRQLHELTGLPIYNGLGFGHIAQKQSFPLGARCQIAPSTIGGYRLTFSGYPTIAANAINVEGLWQVS